MIDKNLQLAIRRYAKKTKTGRVFVRVKRDKRPVNIDLFYSEFVVSGKG